MNYLLYGLSLSFDHPLNHLPLADPTLPADLRVHWIESDTTPAALPPNWDRVSHQTFPASGNVSVWQAGTGQKKFFQVRYLIAGNCLTYTLSPDHKELWVSGTNGAASADAQAQLVGPVIGWILRRRGMLCLHASVVSFGGRAVAFIGTKRTGKSTLAVACQAAGGTVLSDDLLVLKRRGESFRAHSGYSYARLRPDAARALSRDAASLPSVYAGGARLRFDLPETATETDGPGIEGVPLAGLYLLQRRQSGPTTPQAIPTTPQEALPLLAAQTYARFALAPEQEPSEFIALAELVRRVPVRKLTRANDLTALSAVCAAVCADLTNLPATA